MKSKPCLALEDCKKMAAACESEALRNGWNVAIAILDDGGHLLLLLRMDGATPANAQNAILKGHTAAVSRRSTKIWEERIAAGRISTLSMPVMAVQGGIPLAFRGECVGGIGVSGVKSHEDEQIALAGAAVLAE
ncbi:MAG: heme-binding protein [Burkholderiales bacterium]|nr:heme-binding protein [Burkholderiales bacterium]